MRIGILTIALQTNYGGILQAAALYRFLQDSGFQPVLLQKEPGDRSSLFRAARSALRRLPLQNLGGVRGREKARARHYPFIERFLPSRSRLCHHARELAEVSEQQSLDALVVGSDQVWRREYHRDLESYFLNFVSGKDVRKLSYAASFGHSYWQETDSTKVVSTMLADFHAVSVREGSGVRICQEELGRGQCDLVLDPTLIVDPALYLEAAAPRTSISDASLVCYILDPDHRSDLARTSVHQTLGSAHRTISLSADWESQVDTGQWLRAFTDADFVLTDSYHGTVFAILFRKNFVALGNRKRGLDRFTSLLERVGLGDRLVLDGDTTSLARIVGQPINYDDVYVRLAPLQRASREFLLRELRGSCREGSTSEAVCLSDPIPAYV